jgi:hypothetical protein
VELTVGDRDGNEVPGPLLATQGILWGFTGTVTGLKTGTWDFVAGAIGHEFQVRQGVVFEPRKATPLDFRLLPASRTRLVFRTESGEPVEGVRVSIPLGAQDVQALTAAFHRRMGDDEPFQRSAADGQVTVLHVKAGPRRVVARRSGYAVVDREIGFPADGGEVAVTLTRADTEFVFRIRITRVSPGSEAERRGLRAGDVLLRYHDRPLDSRAALSEAIAAAKQAGLPTVALRVRSGGTEADVEVATGVLGVAVEEFEE